MASDTVSRSPKTFSPRVLIHRTDYNGPTNTYKRGKVNVAQSRKSLRASPLNGDLETSAVNKKETVEFDFKDRGSGRKQPSQEMIKIDGRNLKLRQDLPVNRNGFVGQRFVSENSLNYWNEATMASQSMKYFCRCCQCCSDFSRTCRQQPKDVRNFKTILPHIFKITDDQFYSSPKGDSLRWTLFNSSIVNKNLLDLNYNRTSDGPSWSNRWIYPDLESYSHHILKDDVFNGSKASTKSFTSVADSAKSSAISSCLTKTLPIAIGNSCYNACDITKSRRIFWPLLSQNSSVLPVPSSATSLSFNIPPKSLSSPSTPPSPSLSSVCLVRQASFFTYDPKPLLCDGHGSSGLQGKFNNYPPEGDESTSSEKRSKYSDRTDVLGRYHSDVPYVNSLTSTTQQNGTTIAKTTSIYKVPKDTVNEKRQIQKLKNFHCPFCNVSCSNRGQLQGHVRIHTGERPFVCQEPQCRKAFIRNEELTRHRRIHTGERPHICSICKKAFTRKDHLSKHMKTHS